MSSVFNICGGENASYTPPKKGGGETPSEPMKDVNFIDYDGKIVASYTADEFASLSAMPDNPSHEGLVAQGWNWSFEDAQEYVAEYGKLIVGQMYITESGDTEIDITLYDGRLEPMLGISPNGVVEIDWGDGSAVDTVTGASLTTNIDTQHVYANEGDYTIKLHVVSGEFDIVGNSSTDSCLIHKGGTVSNEQRVYQNAIKRVRLGSNVRIAARAFSSCYSLKSATIPIDSVNTLADAFKYCRSLEAITIPNDVTTIFDRAFQYCNILSRVAIPNSVERIYTSVFQNCNSLVCVTIPKRVINLNQRMLSECYSLASVTIPSGVTSIDPYVFYYCYGLKYVRLYPTTPPSLANTNAFGSAPSDCVFIVPQGSLEAYQSASNWSTYASRMVEASA